MNKFLVKLTQEFKGNPFTTMTYNGRPVWIAGEVSLALGYSEKRTLGKTIRGDWSEDFIENEDFVIITGEKLQQFKQVMEVGDKKSTTYSSSLMLLFKTGMRAVFLKTNKPVGKKLRHFFIHDVMPQLELDGQYSPHRTVVDNEIVNNLPTTAEQKLALAIAKEARIDRELKAKAMRSLVKILKRRQFDSDIVESYEIVAVEKSADQDLSAFKPVPINDGWETPTEMAEEYNVTLRRIAMTISELQLKTNPVYSKAYVNKAKDHNRTVTCYRYSPEAQRLIKARLLEQGHIKPLSLVTDSVTSQGA